MASQSCGLRMKVDNISWHEWEVEPMVVGLLKLELVCCGEKEPGKKRIRRTRCTKGFCLTRTPNTRAFQVRPTPLHRPGGEAPIWPSSVVRCVDPTQGGSLRLVATEIAHVTININCL